MAHHAGFQNNAHDCPLLKTIAAFCAFLTAFGVAYFALCSDVVRSSFGIYWGKGGFVRTTSEQTPN